MIQIEEASKSFGAQTVLPGPHLAHHARPAGRPGRAQRRRQDHPLPDPHGRDGGGRGPGAPGQVHHHRLPAAGDRARRGRHGPGTPPGGIPGHPAPGKRDGVPGQPRWPRRRTEPPRSSWTATAISSTGTRRWAATTWKRAPRRSWDGLGFSPDAVPRPAGHALGRLADARGPGPPPAPVAGPSPAGRADQPPGPRVPPVARGFPGGLRGDGGDHLPRPVLPEPRGGPHRGAGAGALQRCTSGDYDDYQAQKLLRQEQLEAAQRSQAEQIEKMERFIRKFRYKATKARQVQSRIKQLDKIERVEMIRAPKRIHFRFPQPGRSGDGGERAARRSTRPTATRWSIAAWTSACSGGIGWPWSVPTAPARARSSRSWPASCRSRRGTGSWGTTPRSTTTRSISSMP